MINYLYFFEIIKLYIFYIYKNGRSLQIKIWILSKIAKNQIVTYPLIIENLSKDIKNIYIIIDMINSKHDKNREKHFIMI